MTEEAKIITELVDQNYTLRQDLERVVRQLRALQIENESLHESHGRINAFFTQMSDSGAKQEGGAKADRQDPPVA